MHALTPAPASPCQPCPAVHASFCSSACVSSACLKPLPALPLHRQGSPEAPRCGFSRKVVDALQQCGAQFGSFDILSDEAVRQGLKVRTGMGGQGQTSYWWLQGRRAAQCVCMACCCAAGAVRFSADVQLPAQPFLCATNHLPLQEYSQWPTYPQLYVNGELLGGCDIVLEMQASVQEGNRPADLPAATHAADAGKQALYCACQLAGAAGSDLALPPWIQQPASMDPAAPSSIPVVANLCLTGVWRFEGGAGQGAGGGAQPAGAAEAAGQPAAGHAVHEGGLALAWGNCWHTCIQR